MQAQVQTNGSSGGLSPIPVEEGMEQLKGHFLASLNHELRTPLSGVVGMTDLLLETSLDGEQREYVETTRQCALQLLDTLNVVLAYSSLAAGQLKAEKGEFHLRQALDGAAQQARSKCADKGIEFRCDVSDVIAETIHGDAHHFREVFAHLLANAVKFTERGWVELTASKEPATPGHPEALCVQIKDTGIGIPNEQLSRIFESFSQVQTGLDRSYSGLGLGLALVDKLVRLMGGSIEVESRVGLGSTFTVRLPIGPASIDTTLPSRIEPVVEPVPVTAATLSKRVRRILVIEDNVIAQQVVRHILSRSGYQLDVASTGHEALEMAAAGPYGLVIADIQLPGMDGFETVEHLRLIPGFAEVPVVGLSADDAPETRNQAERAGFAEFMPKPLDRRLLLDAIQRIIGS
jgi:CheY-like chemotaxis protein